MSPAEALAVLDRLAVLAPDWDSYGARPIAPAAIATARQVVAFIAGCGGLPPQPVPTVHGGVLLDAGDVEIVVYPDGTVEVLS